MAQYLTLPNGNSIEVPEGMDQQTAYAKAIEQFPEAFGLGPPKAEPETGFIAGVKSGFENLKGDIGAIGAGLGIEGGAEYSEAQREKAGQIYRQAEFSEDPIDYVTGLLGQSAAYMAAPIVAAGLASTAPVSGALGLSATAAGLLGAGAASATQFTGSNLSRQLEEGTVPEDLQLGAAVAAAIPQAALDTAALRFLPGVNKLLGKFGREATREEALGAARKLAEASAAGLVKSGGIQVAKNAGIEGLTEAGQQVFERMQAGLDMMDEQARGEYLDNFIGGATLGGLFGAGSRIGAQGRAKDVVATEDRRVADEQAKLDAQAQAARDAELAGLEGGTETRAVPYAEAGPQGVLPGMEAVEQTASAVEAPTPEVLFSENQYLDRVLEDNRMQQSAAVAKQDYDTAESLAAQYDAFAARKKEVESLIKQSGAVDTESTRGKLQRQIAATQRKLETLTGDAYDPVEGRKLISALRKQQGELAAIGGDRAALVDKYTPMLDLNRRNAQASAEAGAAEMAQRQAALQAGTAPDEQMSMFEQSQQDVADAADARGRTDLWYQEGPVGSGKRDPNAPVTEQESTPDIDRLVEVGFNPEQAVSVPETLTRMPSERFNASKNQFDGLLNQVKKLSNSMVASNRDKAQETRDQINNIRTNSDGYLKLAFDARAAQDEALNNFLGVMTDIRSGIFFGGRDVKFASSSIEGLNKQAQEARAKYIQAALQEAAIHRRAEGRPALTRDEALKAASDMETAMTAALDEITTRSTADRSDAYKETRIVAPAQMRGAQIVSPAVLETRDSRPLEERPFGAPRAAQEVIAEGLNVLPQIRDALIGKRQARVEKPVIRTQFAGQEATRVAEERGETATTLKGELARRTEFVRNKMAELPAAMRPRARDVLNEAADIMDGGKASRNLLDAVEGVVDDMLAGRQPRMSDLRSIKDIIAAKAPTAVEQREAGQKSLFAGTTADRRREDQESGVIRKDYKAFAAAPVAKKARDKAVAVAKKARDEAVAIAKAAQVEIDKIAQRVRLIGIAQDAGTRYLKKQVELQKQIDTIRSRIADLGWMNGAALKPITADMFTLTKPEETAPVIEQYNAMVAGIDKQNALLKQKKAAASAGIEKQLAALEEQQKRVKQGAANFFASFAKTDATAFADPVFTNEKASATALFNRRASMLDAQRADLQETLKMTRVRLAAEMIEAKKAFSAQVDVLVTQTQAAADRLKEARKTLAESSVMMGITKAELQAFDDVQKKIDKQFSDVAKLRAQADENVASSAIIAEAHRDLFVQFEYKILKQYEKEFSKAKAKLGAVAPAELKQLSAAAAAQRARAAKVENEQRLEKEAATKDKRELEQRMLERRYEGSSKKQKNAYADAAEQAKSNDVARLQKILNSVDDVLEERKAAKGKRAIGPVTRTQSAAPASLRGGTEESKAGLGRTGTSQRLSEARGIKQRNVPITSAEMAAPADMSIEEFGKLSPEGQTAELNRRQMKADLKTLDTAKRTITRTRGTKEQIAEDKRIAEETFGIDTSNSKWRQKLRAELARQDATEAEALAADLQKVTKGRKNIADVIDEDVDSAEDNYLRENSQAYDAPSFTPVKVNVIKALRSGDAVKAAELLAESGATPFVRKLSGLLATLLGNVKVEMVSDLYVDGKRAAGSYESNKAVMQFDEEAVSEEVILHEMIHAVTLRLLKAPIDTLTDAQKAARVELESMFAAVKKNTNLAREYGITNIAEFASEMLSNRVLQNKLANVKWTGGGNMVTRFINKVLAFLGLKEGVDFNEQATQNILNLFEKAMPMTEGRQIDNVASVLRGVFPNTEPKFAAGISKEAQAAAGRQVARTSGFMASLFSPAAAAPESSKTNRALAWRTQLLDRFAPIEDLLRKGVERGVIPDMQLFQTLYYMRFGEQVNQYVAQAASNGVVRRVKAADGTHTFEAVEGDNIARIAETLRDAGIGNEQAAEEMFTTWMAGLRAGQGQIGWDKLNFKDAKQAKADWDAVNKDVQNNPKIKDAFESARKQYRQYNKDLLTLLSDSGAMSSDEAVRLSALDYVPFYRKNGEEVELMIDREKIVKIGNLKNQPYLKELIGGEDSILPFFESALQNTRMILDMGMRNIQTKDVAYVLQKMGSAEIRKGSGPAGTNIVRFREGGEMKHAVIDDAYGVPADLLVKGLEGIKTTIPAVVRLMSYPANLLRKTVTIMPTYALRQAIRDPLNAWMVTGGNFTPIASSFKELTKMVGGKSETQSILQQAGAISSNVFTGDKQDITRILRDTVGGKAGWQKLVAKAEGFAIQGDSSTRAVLYNMYREKGMTHMQALLGSLESMNFSRRGVSPSMQFMSMMVPFFNAQIQGLDVLWRAGKGVSLFQKEMNVQALMLKRGFMMAAGTMAYAALMQDDESYKNATPEQRALNWFIPLPGVEASLRVPIPFELGYAFKSIPEMVFNVAFGDQKAGEAMKAFGALAYQTVPVGMPQGMKPIVEVATNYSFFTGSPVESNRMQGLTKSERYSPNTTELAKMLSAATFSTVSPMQVEHLIRGYTGSLGITLLQIPNVAIRPLTDQAERPTKLINEYPVIGTLFQPADGRGVVNAAYDRLEEFQQAKRTYNTMIAEGRGADAKAFAQKYSTEIALNSFGGSFRQEMGELAKLKRGIAASKTLTPDQKRDRVQEIKRLEIRMSRRIIELD